MNHGKLVFVNIGNNRVVLLRAIRIVRSRETRIVDFRLARIVLIGAIRAVNFRKPRIVRFRNLRKVPLGKKRTMIGAQRIVDHAFPRIVDHGGFGPMIFRTPGRMNIAGQRLVALRLFRMVFRKCRVVRVRCRRVVLCRLNRFVDF